MASPIETLKMTKLGTLIRLMVDKIIDETLKITCLKVQQFFEEQIFEQMFSKNN